VRCSSCEPLLADFVEGTLSARSTARVAQHLRTCTACTQLLAELKVVDGLLATTSAPELPSNFTFAVMAEVRYLRTAAARKPMPVWRAVALYLVGTWSVVAAAFFYYGSAPARAGLTHAASTTASTWLAAGNALGSALHPAGVPTLAFGAGFALVLAADALACAAILTFYRRVRPQLVAQLSTTEGA
jgi:anti-sigma factor RsiW